MPLEENRYVYLGKTSNYIYVYLGASSAKFAKLLYEKAGIDFEIQKTDLLLSINDFTYLYMIRATTFKANLNRNIIDDLKKIIEAYDVLKENEFILDTKCQDKFLYSDIRHGVDHVFYNKDEKITIFIPDSELPDLEDSICTCVEWSSMENYKSSELDKNTFTNEKRRDILYKLFHKLPVKNNIWFYHKLDAFERLYLDSKESYLS